MLAVLEVLEEPISEMVVIGVQPLSLDVSLELTPEVASRMDEVIEQVMAQLQEWHVEVGDCD